MKNFKVYGTVEYHVRGWDDEDVEEIMAKDLDDAMNYARDLAIQDYESYEGLHGFRTVENIMEEDEIEDYDDAYQLYVEERESWLNYDAKKI